MWCTDCVKSDGEVLDGMRFPKPFSGGCVIQLNQVLNEPFSMSGGDGSGSSSGKVKDVIPIDSLWYIIMQYCEGECVEADRSSDDADR